MTLTDLERALQRCGDDLYRLALLLTSDEASAGTALTHAARRLAETAPSTIDERALLGALMAVLPPERRRWLPRRLPAWARPPRSRIEAAPLLAALARLPRRQQAALGLVLLRGFEPEVAAALLGSDVLQTRCLVRDALVSIAPYATPDLARADLDAGRVPDACQPVRAALALGGDMVHTDSLLRGHLALCDECRAAEQAWQRLRTTVENELRGALRTARLPASVMARMQAAFAPAQAPPTYGPLANPRLGLALVTLLVIALIGVLVLPRRPSTAPPASETAAAPLAPADLVRRAAAQLYAPPPGSGVWHGRWEIRWSFVGGSYAPLNAELWIDTATPRHRVQLVHRDGGGPYEFELADGENELWYAVTPSYGPSLYPLIFDQSNARVQLQLPAAEQERMLRARLDSGAWGLAAAYLRQAQAASELRSWGRQRTADGASLEVIGFRGISPLALPPDAPEATASRALILLTIDVESGTLREVRELIGPENGEQSGRTTWRFLGGEWLSTRAEIERAFELAQAWNGIGNFAPQNGVADPALPVISSDRLTPLALGVQYGTRVWMPARAPTGATRAVLLTPGPFAMPLSIVYLGEGRRLAVQTNQYVPPMPLLEGETVVVNGHEFKLRPGAAQGYQAMVLHEEGALGGEGLVTWVSALGYTRAEVLDVLRTLGPPSLEAYHAQAALFADRQSRDPAAFDALLNALASSPPPPGMAHHFVERTFTRHDRAPDPLPDPYHLPRYRGYPEQLTIDNWTRGQVISGTYEATSTTRGPDGTVYARQYHNATEVWYYDAQLNQVNRFSRSTLSLVNQINTDQYVILRLLACGSYRLATLPDGTRVVSSSMTLGRIAQAFAMDPCTDWRYEGLLADQRTQATVIDGPYLLDVADQPISTWVYLGAGGRAVRIEVRAGLARDGTLLEAWELVRDELVLGDRVPAGAFDATPPAALTVTDYTAGPPATVHAPHTITLTEALALAQTPLFGMPPQTEFVLTSIEAGTPPPERGVYALVDAPNPFYEALRRGIALHLIYLWTASQAPGTGAPQLMQLYEGPADRFGAYLRTQPARWRHSAPIQVALAGHTIDGWQVTLPDGGSWVLVEVDGTLLAVEATLPEQQAAIARLERLPR